jgi:hypothetical protein
MAKKKAEATQAQQNGAAQSGTKQPKIRSTTVQAVKDCLDKGIESPSKIVEVLKEQGIEVSPNYVSLIKGKFRKGKKRGRKPGRKPAAQPAAMSIAPAKRSTAAGLSPQDLASLADLSQRAGGAENLRAYLDVLTKVR